MRDENGIEFGKVKKENQLVTSLKNDTRLDEEDKIKYTSMANLFLVEFDKHIDMTSIDLDKEIPLGIDVWKEFLEYPIVRSYIQSFKNEKIEQLADKGLMKGDRGALNIKRAMAENGPAVNNSNIILIRLPEKEDY